jgi:hypothetical protein
MVIFGITVDAALDGAEYPAGTRVQVATGGGVEIVSPGGDAEVYAALPAAALAAVKRTEIRAAKDAEITEVIGTESGIHLALGEAIALVEKAVTVGLTSEERQSVDAAKLAQAVSEAINAKQDALLAEIDRLEAAGDRAGLVAVSWGEPEWAS